MNTNVIIVWWYGYLLVSARSHKQEEEEEEFWLLKLRTVLTWLNCSTLDLFYWALLAPRDCSGHLFIEHEAIKRRRRRRNFVLWSWYYSDYIEIKMPKAKRTWRIRKHRIFGEIHNTYSFIHYINPNIVGYLF